MINVLNQISTKKDGITTTYKIGDLIEGYYDSATGKFYEESTHTTEIEGASGFIYVDLTGNNAYIYKTLTSSFESIIGSSGGGGSIIKVHHLNGPSVAGDTVTASKGTYSVSSTFDSSGNAFIIGFTEIGEITITATNGSETGTAEINIPCFSNYSAIVGYGLDYKTWLIAGGLNPSSYASLNEVLADEEAIRRLMTKHDAIDYLATTENTTDEMVLTVINNDICAKWINLRDYALDKLSAKPIIKNMMDAANKYGCGEWALLPQVPIMTSDTAPYGEAFYSGSYTTVKSPYLVFDNDATTESIAKYVDGEVFIGYHFINPVKIIKFAVSNRSGNTTDCISKYKLQASNDGITWQDVSSEKVQANTTVKYIQMNDADLIDASYTYYRVYSDKVNSDGTKSYINVMTIQFYAWGTKCNVPVMTSATTPFGSVTVDTTYSSQNGYYAFDGNESTYWESTNTAFPHYVSYQSMNPICVRKIYIKGAIVSAKSCIKNYKIQGSNDGSTWEDIYTGLNSNDTNVIIEESFPNDKYYIYHRLYAIDSHEVSLNYFIVHTFQIYGHEMKVSVPIMSGATTPCGEAFADTEYTSTATFSAWKAFSNTPYWESTNTAFPHYIGYGFISPKKINMIRINCYWGSNQSSIKQYEIQGSNDKINWETISDDILPNAGSVIQTIVFNNDKSYKYYRILILSSYLSSYDYVQVNSLNFYGFDYSEYDWDVDHPKKYLYDHGLELENLDYTNYYISGWTTEPVIKEPDQLYFPPTNSSTKGNVVGLANTLNLNNYDVVRVRLGNKNAIANSCFGFIMAGSTKQANSNVSDVAAQITADIKEASVQFLTTNKYININAGYTTRTLTVTEWWLE